MRSKEYRLHKKEALKARRSKYWGMSRNDAATERRIGIALHTPCVCSCHMCGNSRKHFGEKTIQEKRIFQVVDE